jgi:hypothetical protein
MKRFVVERRSEPSVIIMSVKDYVDTIAPSPTWLKHVQAESKRKGLDKLQMRDIKPSRCSGSQGCEESTTK